MERCLGRFGDRGHDFDRSPVALMRGEMLNENIGDDTDRHRIKECGRTADPEPGKLTEHTDETVARFEREIERMDEVTKCLAMTGSYDFILEVYGKDLEALSNVVLKKLIRVPNVRDLQSSVVLQTIKRTARIPLAHLQTL